MCFLKEILALAFLLVHLLLRWSAWSKWYGSSIVLPIGAMDTVEYVRNKLNAFASTAFQRHPLIWEIRRTDRGLRNRNSFTKIERVDKWDLCVHLVGSARNSIYISAALQSAQCAFVMLPLLLFTFFRCFFQLTVSSSIAAQYTISIRFIFST